MISFPVSDARRVRLVARGVLAGAVLLLGMIQMGSPAEASRIEGPRIYATRGDAAYRWIVYVEARPGNDAGLEIMMTPGGMQYARSRDGATRLAALTIDLFAKLPASQRTVFRGAD